MIEAFPQAASPQRLEAQLQKLVAAFISVAEDLTEDQEQETARTEKGNRRKEGSGEECRRVPASSGVSPTPRALPRVSEG